MSATDSANAKHGSGHMTLSNDNPRCSLTQDIPLLLGVECLIHKLNGNGRKTVNPEQKWNVLGETTPQDVKRALTTLGDNDNPWCGLTQDIPLLLGN